MVEWLGSKSEADALTMNEAEEIAEHWREEPPLAMCVRSYLGVNRREESPHPHSVDKTLGPELTLEQYEQLVAGIKSTVGRIGVRKHGG